MHKSRLITHHSLLNASKAFNAFITAIGLFLSYVATSDYLQGSFLLLCLQHKCEIVDKSRMEKSIECTNNGFKIKFPSYFILYVFFDIFYPNNEASKEIYYLVMMWDETSDHMYEAAYIHELRQICCKVRHTVVTWFSFLTRAPCPFRVHIPRIKHDPQPHQIIHSLSQCRLTKYPIRDEKNQGREKQTSKCINLYNTVRDILGST